MIYIVFQWWHMFFNDFHCFPMGSRGFSMILIVFSWFDKKNGPETSPGIFIPGKKISGEVSSRNASILICFCCAQAGKRIVALRWCFAQRKPPQEFLFREKNFWGGLRSSFLVISSIFEQPPMPNIKNGAKLMTIIELCMNMIERQWKSLKNQWNHLKTIES